MHFIYNCAVKIRIRQFKMAEDSREKTLLVKQADVFTLLLPWSGF